MVIESIESQVAPGWFICITAKNNMKIARLILVPSHSSSRRNAMPRRINSAINPAVIPNINPDINVDRGLIPVI